MAHGGGECQESAKKCHILFEKWAKHQNPERSERRGWWFIRFILLWEIKAGINHYQWGAFYLLIANFFAT